MQEKGLYQHNFNIPFESVYARKTRQERIMQLEPSRCYSWVSVEPMHRPATKKVNRFQRIMEIKVSKPRVEPALAGYKPKVHKRRVTESVNDREQREGEREWYECLKKQKERDQANNEELQWQQEQRRKTHEYEADKKRRKREEEAQRRKELRFQKMVEKEMTKVREQREVEQRRKDGFSSYLFPSY